MQNLASFTPNYFGNIQIIMGPMFAGKSSELIRRMKRYRISKKKVLLVSYAHDTRYGKNCVATHDETQMPAFPCLKLEDIPENLIAEADVIGIDEGQFFADLTDGCEQLANIGKIVIVAALDGTYQKKPFPQVSMLIPLAESVIKLPAICMVCAKDAQFTRRTTNETKTEVIGGADKYQCVCRRCYEHSIFDKENQTPTKQVSPCKYNKKGLEFAADGSPLNTPKKIRFVDTNVIQSLP